MYVTVVCLCQLCYFVFFFFKQKTAYEMRISDWSSDVCSSDLRALFPGGPAGQRRQQIGFLPRQCTRAAKLLQPRPSLAQLAVLLCRLRLEDRDLRLQPLLPREEEIGLGRRLLRPPLEDAGRGQDPLLPARRCVVQGKRWPIC